MQLIFRLLGRAKKFFIIELWTSPQVTLGRFLSQFLYNASLKDCLILFLQTSSISCLLRGVEARDQRIVQYEEEADRTEILQESNMFTDVSIFPP